VLRRVEAEELTNSLGAVSPARSSEPVVAALAETDLDAGQLPHDHPQWVRDAVAVSRAARDLVARLRPIVVRVMTFWDHGMRCIVVGGRRVGVDASGSYRIES
jgi:NADPH-dependent glutamate synthase beta subunit-like oxidoreductase